jgi:hypothetical protein
MKKIPALNIQNLFALVLGLKIISSFLGWKFQSPWIMGFTIPLVLMLAYIALGIKRKSSDLTDEKFADTCYYLGFIFTITSIIFCLLDLPNIGTKIQEIAVRFGAAMVSTVLGLAVRVYLVSFRRDAADALKDAEDAVLDATRKFSEQLTLARERLQEFEMQVDAAAKSSVERVNLQVENLSKNHSHRLTEFFTDLTTRNQETFIAALSEVKSASFRLSDSVDSYSASMQRNVSSIESKVGAFTDAMTNRLKTTAFPDDYFVKHLEAPLSQLKEGAAVLASGVMLVNDQVIESSNVLSKALTKLRQKAAAAEDSMEMVSRLSSQQQGVLDSAKGQVSALAEVSSTLSQLDSALNNTLAGFAAHTAVNAELRTSVEGVVSENVEARRSLEKSLEVVARKLDLNASATSDVVSKLDASATLSKEASSAFTAELAATSTVTRAAAAILAEKLDENSRSTSSLVGGLTAAAATTNGVIGRLDALVSTKESELEMQNQLNQQAILATGRVGQVIEELQEVVRRFSTIDESLDAQSAHLKLVSQKLSTLPIVSGLSAASLAESPTHASPNDQIALADIPGVAEHPAGPSDTVLPVLNRVESVIGS